MKVQIAIPAFLPAVSYGGPIQKVLRLVDYLKAEGAELLIVTSTLSKMGVKDLPVGPFEIDGIDGWRLPTLFTYRWSPWVRWDQAVPRADIVHVIGAWNGLSYSAMSHASRRSVPFVWEPAGMLPMLGRKRTLKRVLTLYHRYLYGKSAGTIWTSRREESEAAIGAVPAKTFLRPNPAVPPGGDGGMTRSEARAALALPAEGTIWGYLGRIDSRKGIPAMLKAWNHAQADGTLIFAGPIGMPRLARAIADAGTSVWLLPPLGADLRWSFLRAIDCLVLIPEFGENFGNVVLEAVSVGTPVVASKAVGALEWLEGPGVKRLADNAELSALFREGKTPPAPQGIPEACAPERVAGLQMEIYRSVLEKQVSK